LSKEVIRVSIDGAEQGIYKYINKIPQSIRVSIDGAELIFSATVLCRLRLLKFECFSKKKQGATELYKFL